jgi:hypothetical protein
MIAAGPKGRIVIALTVRSGLGVGDTIVDKDKYPSSMKGAR